MTENLPLFQEQSSANKHNFRNQPKISDLQNGKISNPNNQFDLRNVRLVVLLYSVHGYTRHERSTEKSLFVISFVNSYLNDSLGCVVNK